MQVLFLLFFSKKYLSMKDNIYNILKNNRNNNINNSYNTILENLYNDCIKKIHILNNNGMVNFNYEILLIHPKIDYITKELNKLLIKNKFKTKIININIIFIDWS